MCNYRHQGMTVKGGGYWTFSNMKRYDTFLDSVGSFIFYAKPVFWFSFFSSLNAFYYGHICCICIWGFFFWKQFTLVKSMISEFFFCLVYRVCRLDLLCSHESFSFTVCATGPFQFFFSFLFVACLKLYMTFSSCLTMELNGLLLPSHLACSGSVENSLQDT